MTATVVEGRSCAGCAMCCYLASVAALSKPAGVWCRHCSTRRRCDVHGRHPAECQRFHCGWLTVAAIGDEWTPSRARIVLVAELDGRRLTALVDPKRPDAWRKQPYHGQLRAWAEAAVPHDGQVVVRVGERYWVILPDADISLGVVGDDEVIVTEVRRTPEGPQIKAMKLPRADPRAAGMT